ncbi:uncharacterized protein LOC111627159 [Centruroides sculpturatus]|uniref:uncharacterized protein LOC111627159 n=1 Tax=Centruroides sculpturatus TaxID=218467 RepID=UPI000C6E9BF9|nr:uncharacterized protein LOC111627159 [Centruroides sculpturatus]
MDKSKIRNFAIIAHIDHGKSTLADRILELTQTVSQRELKAQHLDSMELEQERGITIKLNAVQIVYKNYLFHLIDTPGHVDFGYEVSRSLSACEGVLLVVDAAQGIQAQTLANVYLAIEHNLAIIPIINKIDLPTADPDAVSQQLSETLGIKPDEIIAISAKTGQNLPAVMEAIIKRIPPPINADDALPLQALVFDSYYDTYRGVICLVRIFGGQIKVGDNFKFMSSGEKFEVTELGIKNPQEVKRSHLEAGEVGWLAAAIRSAQSVAVGDTITLVTNPAQQALPGFKKLKPVVFTGFYPLDNGQYPQLRDSLEKIALSDAAIVYAPETSQALGHGYRIGFLGLLHMEVLQQRLEREFKLDLVTTAPTVSYRIKLTDQRELTIENPSLWPDKSRILATLEPFIKAEIIVVEKYLGQVLDLCQSRRGTYLKMEYLDHLRRKVIYRLPLAEVIFDFFDHLKSLSKGYATFDYDFDAYQASKLVKVDILLNGEPADAFAFIAEKERAYSRARQLVEKLKQVIPRHNFEIPVQAAIGAKVIARETIKAFRKDVTAKLYGGDRTRRDKLLKKQKKGKQRARQFGVVNVPQEAFLAVLKTDHDKHR